MTTPATRASAVIPDWLVNLAALGWRMIVIAALIVVLWQLSGLLWTVSASIAIAIVIAAAFAPFVLRLRARGRSRAVAAAIVWVVAIAVLTGAALLLSFALLPYAGELVARISAAIAEIQARVVDNGVPPDVAASAQAVIDAARDAIGAAVGDIVAAAGGVITVLVLASFLVFFFLKDGDKAWVWVFQAVSDQKRERITEAPAEVLARPEGV